VVIIAATLKVTLLMGNMHYSILKEQSEVYELRRLLAGSVVLRVLPMATNFSYVRDAKVWHIAV
jgi:hypothetical protein